MVSPEALLEAEFLAQLNAERAARGMSPLALRSHIAADAVDWADTMATSHGLVHSGQGRAEIIGYGFRSGQITEAFMKSAGHRHLIVDPNLVTAGIGVTCDSNGRIWVAIQFERHDRSIGTRSSSPATPRVTPSSEGSDCDTRSAHTGPLRRLYRAYFLRDSDSTGLAFWSSKVQAGWTLASISDHFAGSGEFINRYGSLSDRDFVTMVYSNVLGRRPDSGGYAYWTGRLRSGLSRGAMMIGFSESPEYKQLTGIY